MLSMQGHGWYHRDTQHFSLSSQARLKTPARCLITWLMAGFGENGEFMGLSPNRSEPDCFDRCFVSELLLLLLTLSETFVLLSCFKEALSSSHAERAALLS